MRGIVSIRICCLQISLFRIVRFASCMFIFAFEGMRIFHIQWIQCMNRHGLRSRALSLPLSLTLYCSVSYPFEGNAVHMDGDGLVLFLQFESLPCLHYDSVDSLICDREDGYCCSERLQTPFALRIYFVCLEAVKIQNSASLRLFLNHNRPF